MKRNEVFATCIDSRYDTKGELLLFFYHLNNLGNIRVSTTADGFRVIKKLEEEGQPLVEMRILLNRAYVEVTWDDQEVYRYSGLDHSAISNVKSGIRRLLNEKGYKSTRVKSTKSKVPATVVDNYLSFVKYLATSESSVDVLRLTLQADQRSTGLRQMEIIVATPKQSHRYIVKVRLQTLYAVHSEETLDRRFYFNCGDILNNVQIHEKS